MCGALIPRSKLKLHEKDGDLHLQLVEQKNREPPLGVWKGLDLPRVNEIVCVSNGRNFLLGVTAGILKRDEAGDIYKIKMIGINATLELERDFFLETCSPFRRKVST